MTREEATQFIGQRRVWVMKMARGDERHQVVCTHIQGQVTLMAGGCADEKFGMVFCAYKFGEAPQGQVWFTPAKFAAMELCT